MYTMTHACDAVKGNRDAAISVMRLKIQVYQNIRGNFFGSRMTKAESQYDKINGLMDDSVWLIAWN